MAFSDKGAHQLPVRRILILSLFAAMELALSAAESLIPPFIPLPGVKLGLANIVTLVAFSMVPKGQVFLVVIMRLILTGFVLGTFLIPAFWLSCGGCLLSYVVMALFTGRRSVSVAGVSLAGAAASIQASGAAVVGSQEAAIRSAADRAGVTIDSQAAANLAQITSSVNASTQNLDAASALLSSDLRAVLLDLGASSARTGLLGSIATSSATANAANSQLATATQTATSYANARSQDMAGIQLQAAQTRAALQAQADLPLFHLDLPATVVHQTVYSFHIGADQ